MKEQLIQILGLDAKASEADITARVKVLVGEAANDQEVRALITASGGSLTRAGAEQVLADRKAHEASQKSEVKSQKSKP